MSFYTTKPAKPFVITGFNGVNVDAAPEPVLTADRGPLRVKDPHAGSTHYISAKQHTPNTSSVHATWAGGIFKPAVVHQKKATKKAPVIKTMATGNTSRTLSDQLKEKIDAGETEVMIGNTAGKPSLCVVTPAEARSYIVKFNPMIKIRIVTFPDGIKQYVVGVSDIHFKVTIGLGYPNKIIGYSFFDPATIAHAGQSLLFNNHSIELPKIEPGEYDPRFEELQQFIAVSLVEARKMMDHPLFNVMGDFAIKVALRCERGVWRWENSITRSGITLTIRHDGTVGVDVGDVYNMFGHKFVLVQDAFGGTKPILSANDISGKSLIAGDLALYIPTYHQALAMLGKLPPLRVVSDESPRTLSDRINELVDDSRAVCLAGTIDDDDKGIIANPFSSEHPHLRLSIKRSRAQDGTAEIKDETDLAHRQKLVYREGDNPEFKEFPDGVLLISNTTFVGVVKTGSGWQGFRIKPPSTKHIDYVSVAQLLELPKSTQSTFLSHLKKFGLPDHMHHIVMADYMREAIRAALKNMFSELGIIAGKTGFVEATNIIRNLLHSHHADKNLGNAAHEKTTRATAAREILLIIKEILK